MSSSWWRNQLETFFALLAICAGNSPVAGEFSAQRPVTRSFDVFFDLRLNKRLSKQSWGWWFETLSCPFWRHCNINSLCNGFWEGGFPIGMYRAFGKVAITSPLWGESTDSVDSRYNYLVMWPWHGVSTLEVSTARCLETSSAIWNDVITSTKI